MSDLLFYDFEEEWVNHESLLSYICEIAQYGGQSPLAGNIHTGSG